MSNIHSGVATGTDYNNRKGRRINVVSIQLRGYMSYPGAASNETDSTMCRIMIIEDSQTNGAAPTMANILQAVTPTSFMNLDNRERFKVHYDRMFTVTPFNTNTTASDGLTNNTPTINFYKKCNIPVVFEGTAATVGSVSSGALWLVTLGSQATTALRFTASVRVRFVDP